jgi:hypothetical protein
VRERARIQVTQRRACAFFGVSVDASGTYVLRPPSTAPK